MADAVACARATSRSAHITDAPSLANRFAIAVPRPPPAPVTSATFPFSLIDPLPCTTRPACNAGRPAEDISFSMGITPPGALGGRNGDWSSALFAHVAPQLALAAASLPDRVLAATDLRQLSPRERWRGAATAIVGDETAWFPASSAVGSVPGKADLFFRS